MAFLSPKTAPHIVTLVLMAGLAATALNIFLPSLPSIAEDLQVDYALVQLLVSGYLAGTAVMQIIIGPLSDRYGRRPVTLTCIAIFIVGALISAAATSFEVLMFGRLVQTVVVSGFALSRAIVRDMVPMEQAASMIGYVTMGMTLVPMVTPAIGGSLDEIYGWRASFVLAAILGVAVLLLVWRDLGETNQYKTGSFKAQFAAYPELIGSRRFWGYTLTASFAAGAFFAFLGGAPYVATQMLGQDPLDLGLNFFFIAFGYLTGNFISGRYTTQWGIERMMGFGSVTAIIGLVVPILLFAAGFGSAIAFFAPMFLLGVGNGMTLPSANAGMVSVRPKLAGSASGLGGAIMIGGGAALSALAGFLLAPGTGPYPLLIIMLAASILSFVSVRYVRAIERQVAQASA